MTARRGGFGLRGRIVGSVLVTTALTLGVAALALLGPLQQGLRHAALRTLSDIGASATPTFAHLSLDYIADPTRQGLSERNTLRAQQQILDTKFGANVTLLGFPDVNGQGHLLLPYKEYSPPTHADSFDDVAAAFRSGRSQAGFGTILGTPYARVAIPLRIGGRPYVLAIRRPIDEVQDAVATVRRAFLTAALVALALTLVLAIPLAATLVRRLRRLRQAALHLASGDLNLDVPDDRGRDEVGDLTRAFATMQRQLRRQEEARRAFVATASHELRTPLTSLDGILELLDYDLRAEEPDLADAVSLLERARIQSRRLGRLAVDLLDLSRLDAEVQLRSEPVELGELSRAVMAEFELGTAEQGIAAELVEHDGRVWALGDPGSVARILRILLDNAVRASPPGSEIRVELAAGDMVALSVQDRGGGVDPGERELIFERFKRGRSSGARAGFGLGLAIGRELAERMGGELELEDVPGPGARFTLRLPAAHAPEQDPLALV